MKTFFSPNIGNTGRWVRGAGAILLFVAAGFSLSLSVPLGVALAAAGGFTLFEAIRGWCVVRACGIKTRL